MHRYKPDLFLSPDGYVSLSAHIPTLAVIHDLNFEHRPGDLPFFARNYYRFFLNASLARPNVLLLFRNIPDKIYHFSIA